MDSNQTSAELHGFGPIPDDQRHGKVSSQFYNWFGSQIHLSSMVLGGVGIAAGLGFWATVSAVAVGNVLGAVVTAACASMGPRRGLPQMVISRLGFGHVGNYLPAIFTTMLFIGWAAVGLSLNSQAFNQLFGMDRVAAVVVLALVGLALALYGYRWIHLFNRWLTIASVVVFGVLTVVALARSDAGTFAGTSAGVNGPKQWLLEFAIAFSFTLSWSSYASDYSRYLPASVTSKRVFWACFSALFVAATWAMVLGALVTALARTASIPAVATISGALAPVVFLVLILSQQIAVVLNMYSGSLATLSWDAPGRRWFVAILLAAVSTALAIAFGGPEFLLRYEQFLFLIAYFVTPWFAVTLITVYVRYRRVETLPPASAFYDRAGPLAGTRWPAWLCFVVGILASVPFMATKLYTGPIGHALGGVDLSYLVGFVVAGAAYLASGTRASAEVPSSLSGEPLSDRRDPV
ncbi:purine-cytosine permease family protein [Pseudonocardia acaciae]|uniref:purine-cytosine permease family protein n=1 Tax=Pseudonocardia acaciae TaxID=551276 RepID=UPI00048E8327|nr:cytosine permease [Pseudonocardia acaciae]